MEILQFEGDATQISWPEEFVAELESLSPQEQLRYFYKSADYQYHTEKIHARGGYEWDNPHCYYTLPVQAVELLDGKIAAVHYEDCRIVLGETAYTYSASDNNGAGYKERADYASLICGKPIEFPRDFYRIEDDTLIFNANMPTDPYAFMYVFVKPWQREAAKTIHHIVFENDVIEVPKYLLSFMPFLKSVRQPVAINRVLVDDPECQTFIGGIRVVDAFVSWDGVLVRVREDAEEVRVLGNIKTIGQWAFADCPSLKRIIIHKDVATIAEGTFAAFGEELTICCEAAEKPEGWADDIEREGGPKIIWDYRG